MKKSIIFLGITALLVLDSCKNKEIPDPVPATPPVENPVPKPSPTTNTPARPVMKDRENNKTSTVSVSKEGVQVESKDGKNKTDISVSKDKNAVEIKRAK